MKTLGSTVATLLLAAAGLWALALGDVFSRTAGALGATSESAWDRPELPPYPGADSLVVRRVLAQADGLHAPSPDGSMIAFMEEGDVAVRDLRTGEVRILTGEGSARDGGWFAYGTMFSPDGRSVAYQWTDGFSAWAIRVVDVETGEVREVLPDREAVQYSDFGPASWSPDGETIAAVLYLEDGSRRLALVPVNGGDPVVLRSFDWRAPGGLAFSPDGQWIAFDIPREQDSPVHDIHLLARDGSREIALLEGPTNQRVAGWMPGGGPFFYLSGDAAQSRLLAVEVDGGGVTGGPWEVHADLRDPWPRGFTHDAFFYVQMPERRMAYTAPLDVAAGALTGPLTPLDPGRSMDWPSVIAWSPEGDRVAYVASRERPRLVVRSRASGAERSMDIPFNVFNTRIEWSPTEDRLAVGGTDDRARSGIHLLELADGSVELLLRSDRDGLGYSHPRWSRDGTALYVTRTDGPTCREVAVCTYDVLLVDVGTGEERKLFSEIRLQEMAVSPDEAHLAVGRTVEEDGVFEVVLLSLDGRESRILARVERPEDELHRLLAGLDWTPDGEHLVIGPPWMDEPGPPSTRSLWIVDREGTELRHLASFVSGGGGGIWPRIHPSGREISVIAGQNRWEIWALEGLDRVRLAADATDEGR